jgi:hypothetical protein
VFSVFSVFSVCVCVCVQQKMKVFSSDSNEQNKSIYLSLFD